MCNLKPVYINPTPIANREIEIQHIGSQVFFVNDKTCFSSQNTQLCTPQFPRKLS